MFSNKFGSESSVSLFCQPVIFSGLLDGHKLGLNA
jgi:hypothetical protein